MSQRRRITRPPEVTMTRTMTRKRERRKTEKSDSE